MPLDRDGLEQRWAAIREEAIRVKYPNEALLAMWRLYDDASAEEREIVDAALSDWILSGDGLKHSVALGVVKKFSVHSARPALEKARESVRMAARGDDATLREGLEEALEALDAGQSPYGN